MDQQAIERLVYEYAETIDSREADRFVSLFEGDGEVAIFEAGAKQPAKVYRGAAELREILDLVLIYDATFHPMTNVRIDLDGASATGTVYTEAHHLVEEGGTAKDITMLIRYEDRYRRSPDGEWRFARRDIHRRWTLVQAAERQELPTERQAAPDSA